jgi:hypothetical protein
MKAQHTAVVMVVVLSSVLASTLAFAASDAQKSFEQLRGLSGSWEGKTSAGQPVKVDYRSTAMGSALMSEIKNVKEDMITMFNVDGDRLLLTHYCAAGNQPRMLATASADGKTITFDFLDATNLASPDAAHMAHVVISMLDTNHHTEEWTFADHGKEMKEVFDLWRKK